MNRRKFIGSTLAATGVSALSGSFYYNRLMSGYSIDDFRNRFSGAVITQKDLNYEKWRDGLPWQMNTAKRFPAIMTKPKDHASVALAIEYAKSQNLKIVCKSGGHNVANSFLRDNSMLIDLAEFADIRFTDTPNEAWVGPSAWSWRMAEVIEKRGMSFPYSHCASVPMGGYLLGGGIGINGDAWNGVGCHSIKAVKVMLPNGEIVIADEKNHSDIWWAVRGSGTGFFGIVLDFKLQLYDTPSDIMESFFFFPIETTPEIAKWVETAALDCPKNVELMAMLTHRPPPMQGPAAADKKMIFVRIAAFGNEAESAAKLIDETLKNPLPEKPLFASGHIPSSMQKILISSVDPNLGLGFGRYDVETIWTDDLTGALSGLIEQFVHVPSPKTHILSTPRHGVSLRDDAAFSSFGRSFVGVYSVWDNIEDDKANKAWNQQIAQSLSNHVKGRYVNETDGFIYPEKIEKCFNQQSFDKIAKLRKNYDSDNIFHGFPGSISS